MTIAAERAATPRLGAGTVERRWRLAALLGLLAFLALAGYAVIVAGPGADANRMVPVLRATKDIRAGSTITADDLGVTSIRAQDPSVLANLVQDSQKNTILGQTAALDVPAGSLIPAGISSPQTTSGMWRANVPVRRMPADLRAGDHVALIVNASGKAGEPIEFVVMQDVRVISVQGGSVDLWLPAKVVAQTQWYADHGGIVPVKMEPGAVQPNLPAGGAS
jgi:hypothetical protein